MESKPLVTALVPSFNHGRYLCERIESIIGQTYPNVELIVIDDCSEDDSDQIIQALRDKYHFTYFRNNRNSGTPFAAWGKICDLAKGDYIWVCESDDVAEPDFLEIAVSSLEAEPEGVLFYSASTIIDENSQPIGSTFSYFHDVWQESRWDQNFSVDGTFEIEQFQLRGQTVPNMSSALVEAGAFRKAFVPYLKRLKLTGDWLFVGNVLMQGRVTYCRKKLSRFRKHEITSRVRVKSARSQAEFILTKYHLFRLSRQPIASFAPIMGTDVIRFLYEPASWLEVFTALCKVSVVDAFRAGVLLFVSACMNPVCFQKFKERFKHAKSWRPDEQPD